MCNYKVGDYIYKIKSEEPDKQNKLYKILNIREEKGGNWHDGASVSYIATILAQDSTTDYNDTEEYMIQYVNAMCQINIKLANIVDDNQIF